MAYVLAHNLGFGIMINYGLNPGLFSHSSSFFGWKSALNWLEKIRLIIWIIINLKIWRLLDVQASLSETSPFLSAQMVVICSFFSVFTVLGMYYFGLHTDWISSSVFGFTILLRRCMISTLQSPIKIKKGLLNIVKCVRLKWSKLAGCK